MAVIFPSCPSCNSEQIVKNGKIHNGKQNYVNNKYESIPKQVKVKAKKRTNNDPM